MENVDLLIHSAAQLCVVPAHNGPQRGAALGDLGIIPDGALAAHQGRIVATGRAADLRARFRATNEIDATGRCVLPGFVDPHTHLPWSGDRANEFEQRLAGATYMEIMAGGGGIMSTVRQTRQASVADLVADNLPRLQQMLAHGTTSAEAKTGYGLDTAAELKQRCDAGSGCGPAGGAGADFSAGPRRPGRVQRPHRRLRRPGGDRNAPGRAAWMRQHNRPSSATSSARPASLTWPKPGAF